jgi:hypothetical protein
VFRAITWMRPLPYPYCVEASLEAARNFVCQRLIERGCAPPPLFGWGSVLHDTAIDRSRRGAEPR